MLNLRATLKMEMVASLGLGLLLIGISKWVMLIDTLRAMVNNPF